MAKRQNKFDENGRSREADSSGRYTYRWHGLPDNHYAETTWKRFGYKPKSKEEFACWVLDGTNSYSYKIYSFEQVEEISGKDAAARRELFNGFDSLTVREVYTRLLSLIRKPKGKYTANDEAFFLLCELRRLWIVQKAKITQQNRRTLSQYGTFFMGWRNKKRYTTWYNKNVDRLRNMFGGYFHPKSSAAIEEFRKRIESQWQ